MQWVFGCCEGDLDDLYWRYTFTDLKKRIKLQVGYAAASHMAQYSSLVSVLAAAFGGDNKAKPDISRDLSQANAEDFIAQVGRIGVS